MKKVILLFILLMSLNTSYSRIFEQAMVQIFVQDASGRKDSVTIGLCDLATLGIDQKFGEKDIYGTPNKDLDIRVIQRDSIHHNCLRENYTQFPPTPNIYFPANLDSKIDFRLIDEDYKLENTHFEIKVFAKDYPVKVFADFNGLKISMYDHWSPIHLLNSDCNAQETVYMDSWNKLDTIFTLPDATFSTLVAIFEYEVGVDEPNISQSFISPNPATDYILIDSPSIKKGLGCVSDAIRIFDVFGNCVMTTPALRATPPKEGNYRIDISSLLVGVYFVRIGNIVQKFMVVR